MAEDPLAQLNIVGQKVLAVPTDLLNIGSRRMTEDISSLSAKVADLGTVLTPPSGMALPNFPPLPGMGSQAAVSPTPEPVKTRSEVVQGIRPTKKMSYLKV